MSLIEKFLPTLASYIVEDNWIKIIRYINDIIWLNYSIAGMVSFYKSWFFLRQSSDPFLYILDPNHDHNGVPLFQTHKGLGQLLECGQLQETKRVFP